MGDIERRGTGVWRGNLRKGEGRLGTESVVLKDQPYSFGTRFGDQPGTNPDELIAAAHASCYSMAFANVLSEEGYEVGRIETTATIHLEKHDGGFAIVRSSLDVEGDVDDIDEATFRRMAEEADKACPVSNLLRPGLEIEIEARLA